MKWIVYVCNVDDQQFAIPAYAELENPACPNCGTEWSPEKTGETFEVDLPERIEQTA